MLKIGASIQKISKSPHHFCHSEVQLWVNTSMHYKILFEAILCPCESQFSSAFLDLKLECLWQPNKITIFLEIHIRWMYPYKKPSWLFYFSPIWILKDPNGGKKWDIFIWHFFSQKQTMPLNWQGKITPEVCHNTNLKFPFVIPEFSLPDLFQQRIKCVKYMDK